MKKFTKMYAVLFPLAIFLSLVNRHLVKIKTDYSKSKFEYLQALAPNAVFVLDESHLAAGGGSGSGAGGGGSGGKAADAPIDLSALKTLALNGQLRVGELVASKVKVEKLQAGVRAAGGNRLQIAAGKKETADDVFKAWTHPLRHRLCLRRQACAFRR